MKLDPVGVDLEPHPDGLAAMDRVPVGDDVDLPARLACHAVQKRGEHGRGEPLGETVDHSSAREATADMTLTRRRFPVTRTTGVLPFGAQDRPGGAASERSPH